MTAALIIAACGLCLFLLLVGFALIARAEAAPNARKLEHAEKMAQAGLVQCVVKIDELSGDYAVVWRKPETPPLTQV